MVGSIFPVNVGPSLFTKSQMCSNSSTDIRPKSLDFTTTPASSMISPITLPSGRRRKHNTALSFISSSLQQETKIDPAEGQATDWCHDLLDNWGLWLILCTFLPWLTLLFTGRNIMTSNTKKWGNTWLVLSKGKESRRTFSTDIFYLKWRSNINIQVEMLDAGGECARPLAVP